MALFLEFTYGKKLGLPAYSSHSFSITLRSEVSDLQGVAGEAEKIYLLLQESVDAQIIESGYTPVPLGAGSSQEPTRNGRRPEQEQPRSNGHSSAQTWACSDRQRDLILRVIEENKLDKRDIEKLSQQLFNTPVLALNKLQASGLIENLLQTYGDSKPSGGNGRRQYQRGGSRQ
jgi:hypothetical protein